LITSAARASSQAANGGVPLRNPADHLLLFPILHRHVLLSLLLSHAYRTLLTNVYARLTIGALFGIHYCMLFSSMWCGAWVVLNQTYALHWTFLYTRARSFLFPSFTAITLLQIYHCWHLFRITLL
jgi:hypothetical protein